MDRAAPIFVALLLPALPARAQTATDALEAARSATPTAWAESCWNALSNLCRQSPFCSSRITVAPR